MRIRPRGIVALALICAAAFLGSSPARAAGVSVPLGPIGFGSVVVDDTNGHVFVSGPAANELLVFDFGGNLVTTIPNIYGAAAMVVHGPSLYVVERSTGAIEAIDLGTLTDSGPVATGLNAPGWLAFAGGRLWVSLNGTYGWAQLASVALDGTVTVFPTSYYAPDLATSQGDPDTLYVAEDGLSPGAVYRLDVSSGSPVATAANGSTDQSNIEQLAVSPDGTRVIPASGFPYYFEELAAATLAPDGIVYPGQPYPSAVAVSPGRGGLVATGLDNGYSSPDISVFPLGLPQAIFTATTQDSSGTANVVPHGLALSGDGVLLFAVTADDVYQSAFHLSIFNLLTTPTTTSVVVAPSPSGFSQPVTVTATVSPSDGGGSVSFYANGAAIAGCSAQPLAATPNGYTATCTTTTLPLGDDVVAADYSGDAQYAASSGSAATVVGRGTTTLTATPAQLVRAKGGTYSMTLQATLTAYGAPVAGRTVVFTADGTQTVLCSAVTDSAGVASCGAVVTAMAVYRTLIRGGYTATFSGDSQYLGSSAQASVST
jgi:Bacterial Ig-like domain (group 3)